MFLSPRALGKRWERDARTCVKIADANGIERVPSGSGRFLYRLADIEALERGRAPQSVIAELARAVRGR